MPPCTSAQHKWRAHARLPRIQANRRHVLDAATVLEALGIRAGRSRLATPPHEESP
jgi:hypothetical protein